jgi:sterol 24-C-methyltransferase
MSLLAGKQSLGDKVAEAADSYTALFDEKQDQKELEATRKKNYTTLVNHYYDLATDFYEFGWGTSFHFAPRFRSEALAQSISRHEHFLALRLKLDNGMKVLDVGCGVGGPMMEIARFSR